MMRKFHRLTAFLLLISCFFSLLPLQINAEATSPPSVSAHSAILMDGENNAVLFAKNANERLPMASTTKIMTALVALEMASLDTVIVTDSRAVGVEGSSIYLTEGEQLTLEQLLYALLLESANDAATAIAIGLAGSVEAFADRMNQTAANIGLKNTHFQNPHGLDHAEHYTTAWDLAQITAAALKHPIFSTIVSTRKTTIPHSGTDEVRLLINHNRLLREYDGCIGVKTGFTKRSGRCLVSAAQRNGATLIAVTLNASDDWRDHTALLDFGFSQMEMVALCDPHQICLPISVVGGDGNAVFVSNPHGLTVAIPKNHSQITKIVEIPRFLYASVHAGETVGRVVYRCDLDGDGKLETIGDVPLTAQTSVEQTKGRRSLWQWFLSLWKR